MRKTCDTCKNYVIHNYRYAKQDRYYTKCGLDDTIVGNGGSCFAWEREE